MNTVPASPLQPAANNPPAAATSVPTPDNKFTLPPPFSAKEFWQKIVQLLSETKGYVRHEDFERVFGVKMVEGPDGAVGRGYGLRSGVDWYLPVGIRETKSNYRGLPPDMPGGVSSLFSMQWSVDAFGDWKKGQCVLAGESIQALLNSGWTMKHKKVEYPYDRAMNRDILTLGKSELFVKHYLHYLHGFGTSDDATCVTELSVTGRPD